MTDKELRKLNRADLLELLLMLKKENDQLTRQVQQLQAQVDDRKIVVDKAGSIAEASLQLNGVFESAQAACSAPGRRKSAVRWSFRPVRIASG